MTTAPMHPEAVRLRELLTRADLALPLVAAAISALPALLDRLEKLEAVGEKARALAAWDWTHLLADAGDTDDVVADLAALRLALDALGGATP